MKKIHVAILSLLLSLTTVKVWSQERRVSEKVYFEGGHSKLAKYIFDASGTIQDSIQCSYFLIYKFSVTKDGIIKSIDLLNQRFDYVALKMEEIIREGSGRWKNHTSEDQTVILPVFLIKDLSEGPLTNASRYTMGTEEYKQTASFLKSYFITPIVIKFMGPIR